MKLFLLRNCRSAGALSVVALAALALFLDAPAAPCEILLNEILAAPSVDWDGDGTYSSRNDEWVEIVNVGTASVDLSQFLLSDADTTIRFQFQGVLAPDEHFLVFGGEAVAWQQDQGRPVTGLSLNNAGDTVRLWQILGSDTVMVDAYQYKSHEATAERSSGRQPDGGAWVLFDALNPYSGSQEPQGTGCQPTPGEKNECTATPVSEVSWGRVKRAYR